MNFNNKRTRRMIAIVIIVVIVAMVATMVIPYLMSISSRKEEQL